MLHFEVVWLNRAVTVEKKSVLLDENINFVVVKNFPNVQILPFFSKEFKCLWLKK
jgi:hypothetical protein